MGGHRRVGQGRERAVRSGQYNTRQRQLINACLAAHGDAYLSVDDVCGILRDQGACIGRTTVYRTLEALAAQGAVSKVANTNGQATLYRLVAEAEDGAHGQLCCLACGKAIPLDCGMLRSFSEHVHADHGFVINQRRTVLYGYCQACLAKDPSLAEHL